MKHIFNFMAILVLGLMIQNLNAQEAQKHLKEARTAYTSKNLQETRFALQQSLREIDMTLGKEILDLLPKQMGNMSVDESQDNISTLDSFFLGLILSRTYSNTDGNHASFEIISDSPLITSISAILALPLIGRDPNQKRIRVGSYRGLMQRSESETGTVSWDVQIPVNNTLVTFNSSGISDEKAISDMLDTIPLEQIVKLLQ